MSKTRRQFLTDSTKLFAATGLAGIVPAASTFAAISKPSDNDKIVLGLIGAKGQGMADLRQALKQPGVECGAVCDIDDAILTERSAEISKIQGKAPVAYKDFRKLLDNKDMVYVECEHKMDNNVADVIESIQYFNKVTTGGK